MFGAQGQASSRDYAFPLTTICGAPIRVSFFVVFFFGLQIVQIAQSYANAPFKDLGFQVLYATGNEFILLFTVLCHEFGHGNMARYLGGSIDHILLWVFGGICFSTRPAGVYDNVKLLKNDLLIVGAGPATHFLQAPAWGLLLWPVAILVNAVSSYSDPLATVGYDNLWQVFLACLNPFDAGTLAALAVRESAGMWVALLWILVCSGISLNVSLFLFNVFFPMYPADGAKLLVTGCMFCCGMSPRKAALVLICTTVPCALLMIVYSIWNFISGISRGGGINSMMGSMMGFMAVMGLFEVYRIWELRKRRQLYQHSLFQTARSWQRRETDRFGTVNRLNQADYDDDEPVSRGSMCGSVLRSLRPTGGWSCAGCLGCLFPCLFRPAPASPNTASTGPLSAPFRSSVSDGTPLGGNGGAATDQVRNQRLQFLAQMDQQAADRKRTVREYMEQQYSSGGSPSSASSPPAAPTPPPAPAVLAAVSEPGPQSFSSIQLSESGGEHRGDQQV